MEIHYQDLGKGLVAVSETYLRNILPSTKEIVLQGVSTFGATLLISNAAFYLFLPSNVFLVAAGVGGMMFGGAFPLYHRILSKRLQFLRDAKNQVHEPEDYWEIILEKPFD